MKSGPLREVSLHFRWHFQVARNQQNTVLIFNHKMISHNRTYETTFIYLIINTGSILQGAARLLADLEGGIKRKYFGFCFIIFINLQYR